MNKNKEIRTKNERSVQIGAFCLFFVLCSLFFPTPASADIVVFTNGRTMSVKSIAFADTSATMKLRGGGEVTFPAAIIARVDPDEVPYSEPEAGSREPGTAEINDVRLPAPDSRLPDEVLATRPFADLISTVAAAHNVDKRLVHAVIEQESNYQPRARSKKGARGLMQLMPGTARQYGVRDSYDPKSNLEAGVRHLKDLLSRMDLALALAAYNAGEGTIKKYGGPPPFAETQNYVRSILRRVGAPAGPFGIN